MRNLFYFLILFLLPHHLNAQSKKINGVNLVSPQQKLHNDFLSPIKKINADWIALTPFAFMNMGETKIDFPASENYWGDSFENIPETIQLARKHQLKIMLKPHIWVRNVGWAGEFDLYFWQWHFWEKNYRRLILEWAKLAEKHRVEIFCIGVEFKKSIERRPHFWIKLISEIRKVYSGQLTYAANWDEYETVPFWHLLDFVGIDGYFPLVKSTTPSVENLTAAWKPIKNEINRFYQKNKKPIIFTEFGYRSSNFACWNQWEIEQLANHKSINLKAQSNGYQAFFDAIWNEKWCIGGFLWKWHPEGISNPIQHSNYSPQGKPAENLIKQYFNKK